MLLQSHIIKNHSYSYFVEKGYADGINLMDLPNEIIEKSLFSYLGYIELKTMGLMNLRLKEITESVIKTRCKCMKNVIPNFLFI